MRLVVHMTMLIVVSESSVANARMVGIESGKSISKRHKLRSAGNGGILQTADARVFLKLSC